jgi:hypothetical protein
MAVAFPPVSPPARSRASIMVKQWTSPCLQWNQKQQNNHNKQTDASAGGEDISVFRPIVVYYLSYLISTSIVFLFFIRCCKNQYLLSRDSKTGNNCDD